MKERIFMIVFVIILGGFLTLALVAVDSYTAPIIKKNRELTIKKTVLDALQIPYTPETIEEVFSKNVEVRRVDGKTIYITRSGDISFQISGSGLWGPIDAVIALKPDKKTIKALRIIYQEETPGLGSRIAEKSFLDRFVGKTVLPQLKMVPEGKAKGPNEVDAITGATLSSKALEKIINDNMKEYLPLLEEGLK